MYFVNKEDIESYRYAVAKVCFLRLYSDYSLLNDVPQSNCMIMKREDFDGKIIISLFTTPNVKLNESVERVECFYNSQHYSTAKKQETENLSVTKLSKEFEKENKNAFETAIRSPEKYYESINNYKFLFDKILLRHKDLNGWQNKKWYKYYSEETVTKNKHNVVDGSISFADPNYFNDPFDVNCFFANDKDMSGLYRIFCVAPSYNEILMWSYYGEEHKGYCFEYNEIDILTQILNIKNDGLCIIGNVEYKKNRPPQKSKLNAISFTEINFYIQAAFTKFEEWSHEKEFRFVILFDTFDNDLEPYFTVKIPISNIYCGLKRDNTPVTDSFGNSVIPVKISKDISDYMLK